MLNIARVLYKIVVVTPDGTQLDVTDVATALGFSEGEKELAVEIQFKLAASAEYNGKSVTELVKPFTPVFIYADMGAGYEEVARGTVQKWSIVESNREFYLEVETADECQALRHNEDDFYFTDGHSSSSILEEVLGKWGVPHEIQISDGTHAKKVYRKKYLCDMVADVLKDLKEKNGGVYFVRAKEGVVQIIPRGTNETIWHFDLDDNLIKANDSYDVSKIVTRVQVVAKEKEEGHQKIESTIDGKTEYGTRQVIYTRGDKETLGEAETAAKKILDEQGDAKRKTTIESPDVPTLRKGDRIRIRSSMGEGYFFVKSIRHNAATQKMSMELDYDKESSPSYDLAKTDESNSENPA